MVGRPGWSKRAAFAGGIALTAATLFAVVAPSTLAGSVLGGIRNGVRLLAGQGQPLPRGVRIEAKSPRAIEREASALARDPNRIIIGMSDFDPLQGIKLPEGAPAELASPSRALPPALVASSADETDYWIVQYDGSASEMREECRKVGVDIVGVVPNRAYMLRLDRSQVMQVEAAPMVRWMGRFLPAWKLDGEVLQILAAAGDPAQMPVDNLGRVRLGIELHPGLTDEAFEAYFGFVKSLGGVEILTVASEEVAGGRLIAVGVDPLVVSDVITQLALLRDVGLVSSTPMPRSHNDHAVWFVQSGNDAIRETNFDVSAPLFKRGLTGRGLLGAVADDGLENDLCFFRYTTAKNDCAWVQGPSADRATPPGAAPAEQPLDLAAVTPPMRTRDRKVVAYYVQAGAAAYSSSVQHGTGVAGCMLGDNFAVLAARPLIRDLGDGQNVRPWNATGTWTLAQDLRADLTSAVDDPNADQGFPNTFGAMVEHHQGRDGQAPGAQLVFQDIGDATGNLSATTLSNPASLLVQASRTGVTSWNGSFGGGPCLDCYSTQAQSTDQANWYRRDLVTFMSAGNEGNQGAATIGGGMAQGKSAITIGWSDRANSNSCASGPCPTPTNRLGHSVNLYSSKGPKSGNMLAPEITYPGTVVTAAYDGVPPVNPEDGSGTSDGGCGPANPGTFAGTSFSSPQAAGSALLVQQYFWDGFYPEGKAPTAAGPTNALRPTNALVRAVLVNSARNLEGARTDDTGTGQAPRPNFGQGWGAPRLDDTLYFEGDPKLGNPEFETERARFIVLNDTPNGFDGTSPLAPEPGGKTRDEILANFRPALADRNIHEFFLNVINDVNGDGLPDPTAKANELRVTLAWSDINGSGAAALRRPLVNNLDLEVVSPGPNGVLDSAGGALLGDDVVFRPKPDTTTWSAGYTVPSATAQLTNAGNITTPFSDTDLDNTVENVFIPSDEVVAGTWMVRVVGRSIPGAATTNQGYPNYALDQAFTRDTDGDGTPDIDEYDTVRAERQGYALVVSGNFTTDQGLLSINKSNFGCEGDELTLTLNDQNGDSNEPPCTGERQAIIQTTTPDVSFPADFETASFVGTQPTYRSENPVTGTAGFEVRLVRDPADVIHGDGIIQIAHGETIVAEYADNSPCGGKAFAQATVSCQPAIADQGYLIFDGCDYAVPGDPTGGTRPDGFMDVGELNRYQIYVANTSSVTYDDAVISIYPDPENVHAGDVEILNTPQTINYMPPGRIADVAFLVKVLPGMPAQWQMDFIVEVTAPRNGLLFPASFRQTQIFEADVISYRYDTRDPNGELYRKGRIEILKPGVEELPGGANPPSDYVTNEPMWFDPDANPATCYAPRSTWPNPYLPPAACTPNGNPVDPWDFDDDETRDPDGPGDGFIEFGNEGDPATAGIDFPFMWFWKSSYNGGGGCGWEDELHAQLATGTDPLPPGHPDLIAQPWGIWHTGEINRSTTGPYAGDAARTNGPDFYDNPASPNDHTIMWDPPPTGGADNNQDGRWCNTFLSDPSIAAGEGNYYRSMLIAPNLNRVHASNPLYRVEFDSFNWYTRLDGFTVDARNLSAAGWFVNNKQVDPATTFPAPLYGWDQFQYGSLIYSDDVRSEWDVNDNTLGDYLRSLNPNFPQYTYEDLYGPADPTWTVAFAWYHQHPEGYRSKGQYGWGIDDVSFVWTESRDDADGSDCNALPGGQRPTIWFAENRYNACEGVLKINLVAPNETRNPIAVAVSSAAEDFESAILTFNAATDRYEGEIAFTSDTRNDAVGVLLVSAGTYDVGNGTDTVRVEYDPSTTDVDGRGIDALPTTDAAIRADWCDADGNEINDDLNGDGIADCEDDPTGAREAIDFSVINCTSGRLFYIKHDLLQQGAGDGDRFADPGETQKMKLYLVSALGSDLTGVEVKISTDDPICLITDTVQLDSLPGNGTVVDTGFGFEFAVPLGMQSTNLTDQLRTITFRIDVRGTNATNLNEFSTAGESFLTYLPLQAWLLVDVDATVTNADFVDNVSGRPTPPTGTWYEGFNGDPVLAGGLDHVFARRLQAGWATPVPGQPYLYQDTTSDTRFNMAGNSGFCPECDVQDDCSVVAGNCDHYYSLDPAFTPGYDTAEAAWSHTTDWAHDGSGSYKFGKPNSGPAVADQHYPQGVYVSMQMPPLRIATNVAQPELTFWHIANLWRPFFTSGLNTPIDGFVLEISATASPVSNQADDTLIAARYPLSSFRRLSPYVGLYNDETDALNACRALFCRYKHPVWSIVGSPVDSPTTLPDPRAGVPGTPGTWEEVKVDLSDYKGMEVVIQFSAEVLQELEPQNGSLGWFIDEVRVTGVSQRGAISLQATNLTVEPCTLTAQFAADDPACFGDDVQFLDRHTGVGAFDPGTGQPYPLEYEWVIGGLTLRGLGGDLIPPATPGVFGTYDNPRINLRTSAAGVSSPSLVSVTMRIYQNGTLADEITRTISYKDAPVPVLDPVGAAFVGGVTQFSATATFSAALDADRTLYWLWDFGDGSASDSSGPSVTHVYTAPGTYAVTVQVYDEEGCTGTATTNVTVTASPVFELPEMTPATDPDCGTGFDDGNADLEEVVTVDIDYANRAGAAQATGMTGYLSSPDPLVEIVSGVADFGGPLNGGARSATRQFRFIRHNDGSAVAPSCLVVPFQLTIVSNGGAIIQVLDLSFTMGNATNVSFDNTGTQTTNFCRDINGTGTSFPDVAYTGVPGGCLTGLKARVELRGSGTGVIADLEVVIRSPDSVEHLILPAAHGPNSLGPYVIDFEFGASNASPPIADTAGQLRDIGNNLDEVVKDSLVPGLVGTAMTGADQWHIIARTTKTGTCTQSYQVNVLEFQLEGTNSGDLEIGTPLTTCSCVPSSSPVFSGARVGCERPGTVYFTPAEDTSLCNGASDVTYQLWASTTPGQLGVRVDGTTREFTPGVGSCADAACADGRCAEVNPDGATYWDVCNTTTVYWTVIAVDNNGTGAKTPNIGATSPSTENPGAYQTVAADCTRPVEPGIFSIVKGTSTATLWLVPPPTSPTWPTLAPPANANEYRLLRGTLPALRRASDGNGGTLADRDGSAVAGAPAVYDHTGIVCSFATTSRDVSSELTQAGSFYYFVPGINGRGCGGMGTDSEGGAHPGATGCPTNANCSP